MELDVDPYIAVLIDSPRAAYLAAVVTLKREGCTCEPEIDVNQDAEGVWQMDSAHDEDCVLLLASMSARN